MASNIPSAPSYKYQFVSEPDDALKCLICLEVAEEPWQHAECGKLFCKTCLDNFGMDKPCSNCRGIGPYFSDSKSKRETKALLVICDNAERKCEWVGSVGTLEEHVATCMFTLFPCPNLCKDDLKKVNNFMRKDLERHLKENCLERDYTCEYCGEKGTYATIQVHDKTCIKKVIECSSDGCSEQMQRQHVLRHINTECKHALKSCKYESIGCKKKLKRKDIVAHEYDSEVHLHMALDTINLMREERYCINGEPIKFKFTDYQKRKDKNECVHSPSYYVSPNGYRMAIRVYANGNSASKGSHVSVFVTILEGRYDAELKWPFIGKLTLTLLNQLEDKNHHQMTLEWTAAHNRLVGDVYGHEDFIHYSELGFNKVKNTQYLKNDTLHFRMSVEAADHKPWL